MVDKRNYDLDLKLSARGWINDPQTRELYNAAHLLAEKSSELQAEFDAYVVSNDAALALKSMDLLETIVTSGSTASVTLTAFSTDYTRYIITADNIQNATNAVNMVAQIGIGGVLKTTSIYSSATLDSVYGAAAPVLASPATTTFATLTGLLANTSAGAIRIDLPSDEASLKYFYSRFVGRNSGGQPALCDSVTYVGEVNVEEITSFKLFYSSGNINSGAIINLYGIK